MPDAGIETFRGSTVLLTGVGADGQVGQAVARAFARAGASLVLVDRTAANAEARAATYAVVRLIAICRFHTSSVLSATSPLMPNPPAMWTYP